MEDHKKVHSTQVVIKVEVVKLYFEVDKEVRTVNIINMKVNLIEVDVETLKEEEVMVEVIEVNNEIMIQTATIVGNLGTW
jgi:hypothetical protein